MTMTVTIPNELATKLQRLAEQRGAAPERLAVDLLTEEVEGQGAYILTPEEVVAKIKATPPDPASITPASGLLREHLARALEEAPIDAEAWNREWARIEAEMKARDRLDDIIEGRV